MKEFFLNAVKELAIDVTFIVVVSILVILFEEYKKNNDIWISKSIKR